MILIPISLKSSSIHGVGVFSPNKIKEGTLIWSYNPLVDMTFSPEQWIEMSSSLAPPCREKIESYYYFRGDDRVLVCDGSQFMNHADLAPERNVGSLKEDYDKVYALRDIEVGEELLCNYNEL